MICPEHDTNIDNCASLPHTMLGDFTLTVKLTQSSSRQATFIAQDIARILDDYGQYRITIAITPNTSHSRCEALGICVCP